MAFQIKDFRSIVASMINHARSVTKKITDWNVGSVARTLVEAPAIEIDELYQQMFIGLKEAIPVAIYSSFDFARKDTVSASGMVRVSFAPMVDPWIIPAGTRFSLVGGAISFSSTLDMVVPGGVSYFDVFVVADVPGTAGNIALGQSFTMQPTIDGFASATNLAAFVNGAEQESDEQRKVRFAAFIASLNRGTVTALAYGLRTVRLTNAFGATTEEVQAVSIVEPYLDDNTQPVAWVKCYIHNGVDGASPDLLAHAVEVIHGYYDADGVAVPGWKAAGVQVDVLEATEKAVAVTGVLTVLAGYNSATLIDSAATAVSSYLQTLDIGATAVRAEIIARVMEIEGIYNFVLSVPAGDTTSLRSEKIMPGTITITAA